MARLRGLISCGFINDPIFKYISELEEIFRTELDLPSRNLCEDCFAPCPDYSQDDYDLVFVPMAGDVGRFRENGQVVPVVFDVFKKDFEQFHHDIANFRLVYVTDLGVCKSLVAAGSRQVRFMPFSVSDLHAAGAVPDKDIDVIQYGRRDPQLHEYMQNLLLRFPTIHYLWTEYDDLIGRHYFHSSRMGMVGSSDVRDNFWQVLQRCKVSLVSVPDFHQGGRDGIFTVPIRYFESAAKFCHMVSRHPAEGDFLWLGVDQVADMAHDYDGFESLVLRYLSEPFSDEKQARYRTFLDNHVTSRRAHQLRHDLSTL